LIDPRLVDLARGVHEKTNPHSDSEIRTRIHYMRCLSEFVNNPDFYNLERIAKETA
jgi:hypothetical protein